MIWVVEDQANDEYDEEIELEHNAEFRANSYDEDYYKEKIMEQRDEEERYLSWLIERYEQDLNERGILNGEERQSGSESDN